MITLLNIYTEQGAPLPGTVEVLYELLRERPSEANISHKTLPTYEQHERFVKGKPYHRWMLILNDYGQRVGAISVSQHNEIGIAILKRYQRQGYALQALQELRKIPPLLGLPGKRNPNYVANVAPRNEASHQLFTKAGGRPICVTYLLEQTNVDS